MNKRAILLLSVLCHAGLVGSAIHIHKTTSPGLELAAEAESRRHVRPDISSQSRTNVRREIGAVTNRISEQFNWAQVESPDYKEYIAKLRAIQCPEQTIRDIITADVNKLYALKLRELRPNQGRLEYWKRAPQYYSKEERDRQEKYRQLEKEKSALLAELLGEDTKKLSKKETGYKTIGIACSVSFRRRRKRRRKKCMNGSNSNCRRSTATTFRMKTTRRRFAAS